MTERFVPTLIIIGGLSATGKTTLARRLAMQLSLPLICKDDIKEPLCDVLGCADVPQSRLLGKASIVLLYNFAEAILRAGQSCIIESLFHPTFSVSDLQALQDRCPYLPLQIYCKANRSVLIERFKHRVESGERHPGHFDHQREYSVQPADLQPLPLDGPMIELDTSDFSTIDYEHLLTQIRAAIPAGAGRDIG